MKKANQKTYNWNAAEYELHSSSQQLWARGMIERLDLRGDERILDIGCGDGKVTAELAVRVPTGRVLGIDTSAEMIEFAKAKFPPTRTPNLLFQMGDATMLDFDNDFDLVVSFSCLHWVRDHVAVLNGVRRGLKSGGKVVLQFGGKGNAVSVLDATAVVLVRPQWSPYFEDFGYIWTFCSPEEYEMLLCQAGLVPQRIELVPKDMIYEGIGGFEGWMRTTWLPYIERVPETLRDKFVAETVQRYVEQYPLDSKSQIHVQMMRLEVEATL